MGNHPGNSYYYQRLKEQAQHDALIQAPEPIVQEAINYARYRLMTVYSDESSYYYEQKSDNMENSKSEEEGLTNTNNAVKNNLDNKSRQMSNYYKKAIKYLEGRTYEKSKFAPRNTNKSPTLSCSPKSSIKFDTVVKNDDYNKDWEWVEPYFDDYFSKLSDNNNGYGYHNFLMQA